MGLGIKIGCGYSEDLRLTLGIRCDGCGRKNGHTPECPKAAIDDLRTRQRHLDCPACGAQAVDKNKRDLWECRACNTQFQTMVHPSSPQVVFSTGGTAIIFDGDDICRVSVLVEKGIGEFAIDEAIARFDEQIIARKNRKRKPRKPRQ